MSFGVVKWLALLILGFALAGCATNEPHPASSNENDNDLRPLMQAVHDWMNTIEGATCEMVRSQISDGLGVFCRTTDQFRMCLPRTGRGCVNGPRNIDFKTSYSRNVEGRAVIYGDFNPSLPDQTNGVVLVFEQLPNGEWRLDDADWTAIIVVN